jgi:nucleotide-binding universal stress UspA family protein
MQNYIQPICNVLITITLVHDINQSGPHASVVNSISQHLSPDSILMKKSILILTDLSENAARAAEVALMLAGRLGDNLLLLNSNDAISAITYYPIMPFLSESPTWHEDRETKLKLITTNLKHQFDKSFPGKAHPVIKAIIKEGDLLENTKDVLKHNQIEMIIMGSQTGSSTDHFLFGSDTQKIINHATVPVLSVPQGAALKQVAKITFATNFREHDTYTLSHLFRLRQKLDVHLEILHIRQYGHAPVVKNTSVKNLIEEACAAKPSNIFYKEIYGKDIASRLMHYCQENNSDILALGHEHHSFLAQAFKEGTVSRSLSSQLVPLLIIPQLESEKIHKPVFKDLSNIVF